MIVDMRNPDDNRWLLDSTRSSDEGLDASDSPSAERNGPYLPDQESADCSDSSSMVEYKDQNQYDRRLSATKQFKRSWLAINRICYCITLLIFLCLAYTLGLSTSIRMEKFGAANRKHESTNWVKPEGVKIVGLIFCKC